MSDSPNSAAGLSVLILDDDDFTHDVLAGMLEQFGVTEIRTALNGRDGLNVISEPAYKPDFLICDVLMPDMDGMKFLEALAQMKYAGRVILVSGIDKEILALAEQVVQSDGLRILGAISKPIKKDVLAKLMGFE